MRREKRDQNRRLPNIPMISNLSQSMNDIIQGCFNFHPEHRPSMAHVVELLEQMLLNQYVLLNFQQF